MPTKGHEVIPSARRLITSLRDLGYDFAAAVADLIDNSIEAKATLVAVDVEFDGDDSWVRISDNGRGMSTAELKEAMRFGAERDYEDDDLGKFGLGLKTASFSQCQCLTVASRNNPDRADISAYRWDLEHVRSTNRWEILPVDRNGLEPTVRDTLKEHTGTVVLWQRLDRIIGFKNPDGDAARKRLIAMCRGLEEHLSMVFHRFLSGEAKGKRLKILINGNPIEAWDPFVRDEPEVQVLQTVNIAVDQGGTLLGKILVEPFVLPHQEKFSSSSAHTKASGPQKWNRQQGFYFYRADRMIQSGGWSNLRTMDEHLKLARVAVHFTPKLDEAFKINVAKMRVQLPPQVREVVEKAIGPVLRMADKAYRTKTPVGPPGRPPASQQTSAAHHGSSGSVGGASDRTDSNGHQHRSPNGGTVSHEGERVWTFDELAGVIEEAATSEQIPIVREILKKVRLKFASTTKGNT